MAAPPEPRADRLRRALVVGVVAPGEAAEAVLADGADAVEVEGPGGPVVTGAAEATAAILGGANVLRTTRPRPVRRAADLVALLLVVRG